MSMNRKTKMILTASVAVLIVALTVTMIVVLVKNSGSKEDLPVYRSVTVEAGASVDAALFLKDKTLAAEFSEDSAYDTSKVGDYVLMLCLSDGSSERVTLMVRDTVAPKVKELPPLLVKKGSRLPVGSLLPLDCVVDETSVKVSLLSGSIDTSSEGLQKTSLRIQDEGGNVTKAEISYYVTDALSAYVYEIGEALSDEEALLPGCNASFKQGQNLNVSQPGQVTVYVEVFGGEYILRFDAVDTVPPVATAKTGLQFEVGDALPGDPLVFLASLEDATEVTARYAETYVFDKAEQRILTIILTDCGGNTTTVPVAVAVYESGKGVDKMPPIIEGAVNLTTELGVKPDYLANVSAYDNRDGNISKDKILVDSSAVNLSRISEGEGYPLSYTVYDSAGNKATVTVYVRVISPSVTEEELEVCFDAVMAEISTEGLSRFSVLSKVYDYVTVRCALVGDAANTDGSSYRMEAYWGFKLKHGNDQTYCAMTQVILDKLGIDWMVVHRQKTGTVAHRWLLVDYGIGWLYMDCAPTEGYVWTKTGKVYRVDSPEAKRLSSADIRKKEAMTEEDLKELTALINNYVSGLNYYKIDSSYGVLPVAAVRTPEGGYISPKYTVNYQALSGGTLSGQMTQTVTHGEYTVTVTAVPKTGYRFVMWDDGVKTVQRSDCVKRSFTVKAIFELDNGTISFYDVAYKAGENGTISGKAFQAGVLYGKNTLAVTAVPDEGYYFICWSDGKTEATRSDIVKGNAEYTALFGKLMTITYIAGEGGSINGEKQQQLVPGSAGSYVTAVPQKGYLFKGWSDGVTTAMRRDRDIKDLTVTAEFEKDTSVYSLSYLAGEGGSISGETLQQLICGSVGSAVEAVAAEGYVFVSWSDGKTEALRQDTLTENAVYTALFEKKEAEDPLPAEEFSEEI